MKKWLVTTLVCSALALTTYGDQSNNASAPTDKVYHVSSDVGFASFEPLDSADKVEGSDVDLMDAMAKAGNFEVEFKHQPWESLFPSLNSGDMDIVMSGVTITDDRKQSILFSDPCFEVTQIVLVPKGKKIASSEDLKNMVKVDMVTGYTGDFSVSKLLGNSNPKIAHFENIPLIIKELENGGLGSVVSDSAVIVNCVESNPTKGLDFISLPDFTIENYGIAAHKGDKATTKMLNDTLKKVRESGKCDKIYTKYFAKKGEKAEKAETAK